MDPYNPLTLEPGYKLRPKANRIFKDTTRLQMSRSSFNVDAARVWNNAPTDVHTATKLSGAKKAIKIFCKNLPI